MSPPEAEEGRKSSSFGSSLKRFLKNIDSYGIPVSLTYKNLPLIHSVTGGVATLLARLIVGVYIVLQCKAVIDKVYTVQSSILKRDQTVDKTMYNLTLDNFDFAVYMDYASKSFEPEIFKHLGEYVDLRATENYYSWEKDDQGNPII